jgi:signal transduction histidine kinase
MAAVPASVGPHVARAALVTVLCGVTLALGLLLLALTPEATRLPPGGRLVPVFVVVVGWSFAVLGAFAWWRRPDNPTGALMAAFATVVLLSGLSIADAQVPFLLSSPADALALPIFVHLLLAFPSGHLTGRLARAIVIAGYATAIVSEIVALAVGDPAGEPGCADCPRNPVVVETHNGLAEAALAAENAAAIALALAAIAVVVHRARTARAFERRAFAPLGLAAAILLALIAVSVTVQALDVDPDVQQTAQLAFIAGFTLLPAAFLAGLLRSRFFRAATVGRVIERLGAGRGAGGVERALASALGDPALAVAFWLPDRNDYVDRDGRPMTLPAHGGGAVATEITHHGRRIGALVHDGALAGDPELMRAAAGAAALALENDRLEVELRARLEALRASRARIVEAGDAERRRLGRDLHDGAQQRLVSLLLDLQLARERWEGDPVAARELLDRALENAHAAVDELRDLAAGIHPAVLSQRGLDAALESLATRSPVPVELDVALADRLPASVETAAYFVVAEALTNVAKYARATHARVVVRRVDGDALVEVRDDGIGGADPARGSGLRGLGDRVGALEGRLDLDSPPGGGTTLRAALPVPRDAG